MVPLGAQGEAMKRGHDCETPAIYAPVRFCTRKLKPLGPQLKRYMSEGPLFGYVICCPACSFIEMHQHEQCGFVEEPGEGHLKRLVSIEKPPSCMLCKRTLNVVAGVLSARSADGPTA